MVFLMLIRVVHTLTIALLAARNASLPLNHTIHKLVAAVKRLPQPISTPTPPPLILTPFPLILTPTSSAVETLTTITTITTFLTLDLIYSLILITSVLVYFLISNVLEFAFFLINILTLQKAKAKRAIIADCDPVHEGTYQAPKKGSDLRSPCPYLNALANHGLIKRTGRAIPLERLRRAIRRTLNTSYTLTLDITDGIEKHFNKNVIDLKSFSPHEATERDTSVSERRDAILSSPPSSPKLSPHDDPHFPRHQGSSEKTIKTLLNCATGPNSEEHPDGTLSASDIANFIRMQSRANLPTSLHTFFVEGDLSLLLDTIGGDVRSLKMILLEEKFPVGFESSFQGRMGYTKFDMKYRTAEILLRMLTHK